VGGGGKRFPIQGSLPFFEKSNQKNPPLSFNGGRGRGGKEGLWALTAGDAGKKKQSTFWRLGSVSGNEHKGTSCLRKRGGPR